MNTDFLSKAHANGLTLVKSQANHWAPVSVANSANLSHNIKQNNFLTLYEIT